MFREFHHGAHGNIGNSASLQLTPMGFQAAIEMSCSGPVRFPERDPRPPNLPHPAVLLSVNFFSSGVGNVDTTPCRGQKSGSALFVGLKRPIRRALEWEWLTQPP
jgi:hypothetical protein